MKTLIKKSGHLGACKTALKWLSKQKNFKKAWKKCPMGTWLRWVLLMADIDITNKLEAAYDEYYKEYYKYTALALKLEREVGTTILNKKISKIELKFANQIRLSFPKKRSKLIKKLYYAIMNDSP